MGDNYTENTLQRYECIIITYYVYVPEKYMGWNTGLYLILLCIMLLLGGVMEDCLNTYIKGWEVMAIAAQSERYTCCSM